ncbi:MAG: hypothetical protein RLZZ241_2554 [Bacteroidota bacterium]
MRIDKYLWCTRYFKTRNQATEACRKGAVRIGDTQCKPSREVLPADQITLRINQFDFKLKVISIPDSRVGAKWVGLYREDLTPPEALEAQRLTRASQDYYREKGTGRPTKKDRRDLDTFFDESE